MRRDARYEVASPDNELVETSPRSLEKAAVVQRSASVLVVSLHRLSPKILPHGTRYLMAVSNIAEYGATFRPLRIYRGRVRAVAKP